MEIKEVQERAKKLDEAIATLIKDFQQETRCRIVGVDYDSVRFISAAGNSLPMVKCKIELR